MNLNGQWLTSGRHDVHEPAVLQTLERRNCTQFKDCPSRLEATMITPCVYILASRQNGTLYIGVTSDLFQRMAQHSQGLIEGFTKKHDIKLLVYYEMHDSMEAAISREKRLKEWHRAWKLRIIEQMNPEWKNLFDPKTGEIAFGPMEAERMLSEPVAEQIPDSTPKKH